MERGETPRREAVEEQLDHMNEGTTRWSSGEVLESGLTRTVEFDDMTRASFHKYLIIQVRM